MSGLLDRLLGFLELGKDCVTAETLIQMKDLLRRYPHMAVLVAMLHDETAGRVSALRATRSPRR